MARHLHRALIAILFALSLLLPGASWSHAKKDATVPADGARLAAAPDVISMAFDQPLRMTLIRVLNNEGREVAITRSDAMAPQTQFTFAPTAMGPGAYRVEWRGLASDGHVMRGNFTFVIEE